MSGNALVRHSGASQLRQPYVDSRTCPFFPFGHPAAARCTACCCVVAGAVLNRQYCWGWGEYVRRPTNCWGFRSYVPYIKIIISVSSSNRTWKFAGFILFQFIYICNVCVSVCVNVCMCVCVWVYFMCMTYTIHSSVFAEKQHFCYCEYVY